MCAREKGISRKDNLLPGIPKSELKELLKKNEKFR
jgi:hypothetical protein